MLNLRTLTTASVFSFIVLPSAAGAATWVETLVQNPDPEPGGRYVHQDFSITTAGAKIQGLAYLANNEEQGVSVRYAKREVPLGTPLEEGDWELSDIRFEAAYNDRFFHPHLAQDAATGTPYATYIGNIGVEPYRLEFASFVGDSNGDCGTNFSWQCENVLSACGMEDERLGGGSSARPRLELEAALESPADAAHIVFQIEDEPTALVHARKDFATQSWTCQVMPSSGYVPSTLVQSTAIYHEFDGRLKPQLTYAVADGRYPEMRQVLRSLLDYSGSPLPPLSWTPEYDIQAVSAWKYGTPALAVRDEGLGSQGAAFITGIGVPAVVEVQGAGSSSLPAWPVCSSNTGTWTLDYRVASDQAGSSWEPAELIVGGRPCAPAMAFGWEMSPHVLYHDDALDTLMLTARRPSEPQLWTTAEFIAADPTWSDIIFDPDVGTVSIVFLELNAEQFTVIDGYLQ